MTDHNPQPHLSHPGGAQIQVPHANNAEDIQPPQSSNRLMAQPGVGAPPALRWQQERCNRKAVVFFVISGISLALGALLLVIFFKTGCSTYYQQSGVNCCYGSKCYSKFSQMASNNLYQFIWALIFFVTGIAFLVLGLYICCSPRVAL